MNTPKDWTLPAGAATQSSQHILEEDIASVLKSTQPSPFAPKVIIVNKYSHKEFNELIDYVFSRVRTLSEVKGGEYSGDEDRLLNFRRNAQALALTKEQVWAVYAAKHWDAITQYVQDIQTGKQRPRDEKIEGRVDDLVTYLILFRAMLEENKRSPAGITLKSNSIAGST